MARETGVQSQVMSYQREKNCAQKKKQDGVWVFLIYGKDILPEEQQRYYLIHSWEDKEIYTFTKWPGRPRFNPRLCHTKKKKIVLRRNKMVFGFFIL